MGGAACRSVVLVVVATIRKCCGPSRKYGFDFISPQDKTRRKACWGGDKPNLRGDSRVVDVCRRVGFRCARDLEDKGT